MLLSSRAVAAGRISAAGRPFVAVLHRLSGGGAMKGSKVESQNHAFTSVPPHLTSTRTVSSYFERWPRRRAAFVMFGESHSRSYVSCSDDWGCGAAGAAAVEGSGGVDGGVARARSAAGAVPACPELNPALVGGDGAQNKNTDTASPPPPKKKKRRAPFSLVAMRRKHERQQPITMVTAYDAPGAAHAACAGIDMVLVGDSLGMVVCGEEGTAGGPLRAMG
eukprot:g6422.t1